MTFPAFVHHFQPALSRVVSESERGSVATFYDLTPAMLEEARHVDKVLGWSGCVEYLRFFVVESQPGHAILFQEQVVRAHVDLSTWAREDRLVGLVEREREAVSLDVESCIRQLCGLAGERWFRLRDGVGDPTLIPIATIGPGVRLRNATYWSLADVSGCIDSIRETSVHESGFVTVDDAHIEIEIRRWMARCAAWWASDYLLATKSPTPEGIIGAFRTPVTPSADGWIALRALAREAVSGDPRWPSQPGRIGPDDWYRRLS